MLKHVIEAQEFNLVLGSVDLLVGVFKVGFYHKGRRVSIFTRRSVVGAGISALREDVRNVTVLAAVLAVSRYPSTERLQWR
jgi:hypothetical protein